VVSFEPVRRYFDKIKDRASQNWHVYNYALGSSRSEKEITIFDSPGLASIRAPNLAAMKQLLPRHAVKVEAREVIQIHRLDEIFGDIGIDASRILLKIDTQGYDLEVFRGASGVLNRVQAVQTELSFQSVYENMPGYAETLAEMQRAGFEVSGMFPVTHDDNMRAIEFDCVLVR
jgi:FkbM family methyltransferase